MANKGQFLEYYSRLADDELARIALQDQLVPEAQDAITDELQKRGLSDLSEYKRALDESAAASSVENELQIQVRMKRQVSEWVFVFLAWASAIASPFILVAGPDGSEALKFSGMAALPIAFSCYLGIKARRQGSRQGYVLKFMLPLILLGISTLVVLSGLFLNVWV